MKKRDTHERKLNILQLNCHKNPYVLEWCVSQAVTESIDFICVTEVPFDSTNQAIPFVDGKFKTFYQFDKNFPAEKPYSAIVALNDAIDINTTNYHNSRFRVALDLILEEQTITLFSYYVPFHHEPHFAEVIGPLQLHLSSRPSNPHIITGDFNAHHSSWSLSPKSNYTGEVISECIQQGDWKIINEPDLPTFHPFNTTCESSVIDLTIVSLSLEDSSISWKCLQRIEGTDHVPILSSFTMNKKLLNEPLCNLSNVKIAKMLVDEVRKNKIDSFKDIYDALPQIKRNLRSRVRVNKRGRSTLLETSVPLTQEVKLMRVQVKKLKKQCAKSPNDPLLTHKYKSSLADLKKHMNSIHRTSIRENIRAMGKENIWKVSPLKRAKKKIAVLVTNNARITQSKLMVRTIMEFLHPNSTQVNLTPHSNPCLTNDLKLSDSEVELAMSKLRKGTAAGHDAVAFKLVKYLYEKCPKLLNKLYKIVFETQTFPQQWLISKLTIVPKKNLNTVELNDIRPIGVNSQFAKVFEIIIKNRLTFHAKKLDVMSCSQYATGLSKGAVDLLMDFNRFAELPRNPAISRRTKVLVGKLDIHKAFDNVNIHTLAHLLQTNNFPGDLINLILKYHMNRKNHLSIAGESMDKVKDTGLIQGCVFSPVLFTIFLGPVVKKLEAYLSALEARFPEIATFIALYVDDFIVAVKANRKDGYLSQLEGIMAAIVDKINELLETIGLSLSKDKMDFMFTTKTSYTPTVNFGEKKMQLKNNITILGVNYSNLKLMVNSNHLLDAVNKGFQINKDLFTLGRYISTNDKMNMMHSLTIAKVTFAAAAWLENVNSESIHQMDKLLRNCMSRCLQITTSVPNIALSVMTNLLPASILLKKISLEKEISDYGVWIDEKRLHLTRQVDLTDYFHPAAIPMLKFVEDSRKQEDIEGIMPNTVHIYTDASLSGDEAGFAIVEPKSRKFKVFKACPQSSIYQLEMRAVTEAIHHLAFFADIETNQYTIFTDSMSVISALRNPFSTDKQIVELKSLLLRHQLIDKVKFGWVKAHVDITGNQVADLLASVASSIGQELKTNISRKWIKKYVMEKLQDDYKQWFDQSSGTIFKFFFPSLELAQKFLGRPSKRMLEFYSSKALYLREYVWDARTRGFLSVENDPGFDSPYCECDKNSLQNSLHLIFECAIFQQERDNITKACGIRPDEWKMFRTNKQRNEVFYRCTKEWGRIIEPKLKSLRALMYGD